MTNPGGGSPPSKPAYPDDHDKTIRQYAGLPMIGDQDAINMLNTIKNELFGNADKVYTLGKTWENYLALGTQAYNIQAATNNLSSDWSGDAKTQFDTFNSGVLSTLNKDDAVIKAIGNTLSACASQVYTTYANAIKEMADCVNSLAKAGLAVGFSWVPWVGEALDAGAVAYLWNALDAFVKGVEGLIADSITQIGQLKVNGTNFVGQAELFAAIAAPGDKMGITDDWTPSGGYPERADQPVRPAPTSVCSAAMISPSAAELAGTTWRRRNP